MMGLLLALMSCNAWAGELWLSPKIQMGYNDFFIETGATLESDGFRKYTIGTGLKIRLSDIAKLEPIFGLVGERSDQWAPSPYSKLKLEIAL